MMKRLFIIAALVLAASAQVSGQTPADRREVRRGNRDFRRDNFREAEIDYRKALVKDSTSVAGNYNLANTLYRMEEYDDAKQFMETAENGSESADIFYNKGDIALQNKDYNTAVESFKRSLLLNPDDVEAKENYIYAKKMLENQQQNGGGNDQNQDNNQDQNQNNDQNQDNNQDQNNNQNQDNNQDQNQNNDQNRDQNKDQNQGDDREDRQQPQLSSQAAEQMLQAIEAKEKETQDKVKKEEALRARSRQKEKNW